MDWNLVFFANSAALGVGLAMDAFSVSMANGLNEPDMKGRRMTLIAGVFAFFQFAMPLIGWLCVHTVAEAFSEFEKAIPWIALILLCWIGINMILEGRKEEAGDEKSAAAGTLFMQGIATSIDALSVGFTIAEYHAPMALSASLIIGLETFAICLAGLLIGRKFGTKLAGKASLLGGTVLILIGLEIFIKGMI